MSASVAIDPEYSFHDLRDGRQRVDLARLHPVDQLPELGVALDRRLEVVARPRCGHGKDLTGEVPAAALLQATLPLEEGAVLLDRLPELRDVLAALRLCEHDRHLPGAVAVECEDGAHLAEHGLRGRVV